MKPTKEQVDAEIAALEALDPQGKFKFKINDAIELQIDVLRGALNGRSERRLRELNDEEMDNYMSTKAWLDGESQEKPSESWKGAW